MPHRGAILDDMAVGDRLLTAEEITWLYNEGNGDSVGSSEFIPIPYRFSTWISGFDLGGQTGFGDAPALDVATDFGSSNLSTFHNSGDSNTDGTLPFQR